MDSGTNDFTNFFSLVVPIRRTQYMRPIKSPTRNHTCTEEQLHVDRTNVIFHLPVNSAHGENNSIIEFGDRIYVLCIYS